MLASDAAPDRPEVAEPVVDAFEVVEIQCQQAKSFGIAKRAQPFGFEHLHQVAAV